MGPGVWVIVRRYVPVPLNPLSKLATRTMYVPVTGATMSSITSAATSARAQAQRLWDRSRSTAGNRSCR